MSDAPANNPKLPESEENEAESPSPRTASEESSGSPETIPDVSEGQDIVGLDNEEKRDEEATSDHNNAPRKVEGDGDCSSTSGGASTSSAANGRKRAIHHQGNTGSKKVKRSFTGIRFSGITMSISGSGTSGIRIGPGSFTSSNGGGLQMGNCSISAGGNGRSLQIGNCNMSSTGSSSSLSLNGHSIRTIHQGSSSGGSQGIQLLNGRVVIPSNERPTTLLKLRINENMLEAVLGGTTVWITPRAGTSPNAFRIYRNDEGDIEIIMPS